MKKFAYAVFLCLSLYTIAIAQVPKNQHQENDKALDSIWKFYFLNREQREDIENDLLKRSSQTNDKELSTFVKILEFARLKTTDPTLVEKFRDAIDTEYKLFPNVQARAYQIIGYHYFVGTDNYERAFDAYLQLEKLLEKYGPTVITDYASYCGEIASAYYKFKHYKKAIDLAKKGIIYAKDKWDFYNTIGLCFQQLSKLDSAIHYLKKAVDEAIDKKKDDVYRTISLGNIGYSYYHQQKFELAKPLLKADLKGALRIDDKGLAVGAAIPLADIYLSEKKWKAADSLLHMSRNYIAQSKQYERLERFFAIRSKYYQLNGNAKLALAYRDSTIRVIKYNDSVFNGLLVMRVQQRTDMEKLEEEKNKLENYRKISKIRLWSVAIIFILIVAGLFIVRRYRGRLEKEKKHIEELNRTLALRQRLSADMHDDVGSTLSSISLYTHSLLMQPQNEIQKAILEKIKQNAQNAQECVSEIIWSVNPEMDMMEQVVARMRSLGADMTEHAGIAFTFIEEGEVMKLQIEMSVRRNLYLVYKEAINNVVKYSQCKHLNVVLTIYDNKFAMEITDDGIGFDTTKKHLGNGLINMHRRANEINAQLKIISKKKNGTMLNLILPLFTSS